LRYVHPEPDGQAGRRIFTTSATDVIVSVFSKPGTGAFTNRTIEDAFSENRLLMAAVIEAP